MAVKKISPINDDFDLGLLVSISRKSIIWSLLFFTNSALIAFLYLRYTPPEYKSSSTIQLGYNENAGRILPIVNIYQEYS